MLQFLPFVLWNLPRSLYQQEFCTVEKSQSVFSSDDWKQSKIFLRGAQYRWGNAHRLQWRNLLLEISKKYYYGGGKFCGGSQSGGSILRDSFTETRRTNTGAYLDPGPALGMKRLQYEFSAILSFLSYHKALCAASEATTEFFTGFTLLSRCVQITEWFLISN